MGLTKSMPNLFFKSKLIKQLALFLLSSFLLFLGVEIVGTEKIWTSLAQFPLWVIAAILIAFALNLVVVGFRFQQLLKRSGVDLPNEIVLKANLHGNFASLFLISLFGQVIGRQMFLKPYINSPTLLSSLAAIERIILFLVSGLFCLLGAIWIIGTKDIVNFFGQFSLAKIIIVPLICISTSLLLSRSNFERKLYVGISSKQNFAFFLKLINYTLLAQGFVLGAFAIGVKALSPNILFQDILAAATIVSFVASLPISVNGWGSRELAAIAVFGYIGVPESLAFAVSIVVGLSSTAVVLIAWPFALSSNAHLKEKLKSFSLSKKRISQFPVEKIMIWFLGISTTVFIFFQFKVSTLDGGYITINMSDAFVMLIFTSFVFYLFQTRQLPRWLTPNFNLSLLIYSGLLLLSFLIGVQEIGITHWAVIGRLFGWIVLLGYLSVGALTVNFLGKLGLLRLINTLIISAAIIILFEMITRSSGYIDLINTPLNFEGFSGNRNAFAFQLLVCSVFMIAFIPSTKADRVNFFGKYFGLAFVHGIILTGIYLTASKAGIITAVIILLTSSLFNSFNRMMILRSIIIGLVIWIVFVRLMPFIYNFTGFFPDGQIQKQIQIQSSFSHPISFNEHVSTISLGLKLWLDSVWFGAGLGVFLEKSPTLAGKSILIHSTPVWILAEFGILGAAILITIFGWIFFNASKTFQVNPKSRTLILLLMTFLLFGLTHEIFYQRIFWLALGICLALPLKKTSIQAFSKEFNKS